VGFALAAYAIGSERGYVTRAEAASRTLATLRFFHDAPQGPQATGTAGYKGFFYRFLDLRNGTRVGNIELSTVDTALLLAASSSAMRTTTATGRPRRKSGGSRRRSTRAPNGRGCRCAARPSRTAGTPRADSSNTTGSDTARR
jgi:hypothetical protein